MRVVPFEPEHAIGFAVQPAQANEFPAMSAEEAACLKKGGPCFSALDEDGRVIAMAGILPQWPGRAIAWAVISPKAGRHFVRITREVKRFLASCDYDRVEATVDAFFPQALRWIEMLGFERETPEPMRRYGFKGRPAYLYARIAP